MFSRLIQTGSKLRCQLRQRRKFLSSGSESGSSPLSSLIPKQTSTYAGVPASGIFWGVIVVGGILLFKMFTVVPAGHVGIKDLFGKVSDNTLSPGLHIVNPLVRVELFSVQTQKLTENVEVPSKEGLTVNLTVTALYAVDPKFVREIYVTIGPSFREIILRPHFLSAIREVTSGYEAKDLYNSAMRSKISSELSSKLRSYVTDRGVIVEDTPLREIKLPEKLTQAIESKLQMEQESQRMEFVLRREELEAQRKAIEGQGIANFQRIVSEGISEQLLRWKGIEATRELLDSPNTKVVIVGGKDGLPMIFNTSDSDSGKKK
eukprot:TRINITY_DN3914_c0_g1_i1.p1 TRINITY_DN3914_c0_g1~~TRINITY_DN3914_c0_g1_i1.p1  ORF type:complete len:319 (+),score=54.59 TRINITY_DN3914_c0_g1_i1:25-981(+)